jgi:murein DD-endopeptidase MepM/ murein hydrolase activator NlpD
MNNVQFEEWCQSMSPQLFRPLVPFNPAVDKLYVFDFTAQNHDLPIPELNNTASFSRWVFSALEKNNARYGVGGYLEDRVLYQRSGVFDAAGAGAPRSIHLGLDIWGPAGTHVFAPVAGKLHSMGQNDAFGDYGATLILEHPSPFGPWYSLYGHLSADSIQDKRKGQAFDPGETIARLGEPFENGNWPPHLHFQIILDVEGKQGDYPGVCAPSDLDHYRLNCPDPALLQVVPRP